MTNPPSLRVVFDINVFIDAVLRDDSTFPLFEEVPPKTSNPALNALSLAFDADNFALYLSPHIIRNFSEILTKQGVQPVNAAAYVEAIAEIVHFSGGAIVEPLRQINDVVDFEDNLILDLVKSVDALILVTSDRDLLTLNPWRHRLVLRPADFVAKFL